MKLKNIALFSLILAGCYSTGRHDPKASLPRPRIVSKESMDPRFEPDVIPVLQSHGFTVVEKTTPESVICKTSVGGGFAMSAEISLWKDGTLLARGKGTNPGFGNWLARPAAREDIIARAAKALDQELTKMEKR